MSRFKRPMDNPINWSFPVGRLFGIQIRLHLLFAAGALFVISSDVKFATEFEQPILTALGYGFGTAVALFIIVLLHEFGHCFGARYVGGSADEILLWPLGGLASVQTPHHPKAHFITAAAGPAVNVVLMMLIGTALIIGTGDGIGAVPWNPFRPFTPLTTSGHYGGVHRWMVVLFGINYILLLFNVLIPMFPMDGGRIMQAVLWQAKGYRRSMEIATFVGMIGAIGLGLFALFTPDTSMLLLGIAMFGYITCYQQRQMIKHDMFNESSAFGDEFSFEFNAEGDDEPEKRPGWLARRRARKMALQVARDRLDLEKREEEFDRILMKINEGGMSSLTPKERRLLEEETERRRSLSSVDDA